MTLIDGSPRESVSADGWNPGENKTLEKTVSSVKKG